MNKYQLTLNKHKMIFENYNESLKYFIEEINRYFLNHTDLSNLKNEVCVFDAFNLPLELEYFFNYRYDNNTLNDEEILIGSKLRMLLSYLSSSDIAEIKEGSLNSINKSCEYHYANKEDGYLVDIKIDYSIEEIVVEININNGESYLYTNAFILDDGSREYYFKSHQVCHSSSNPNSLGKSLDLDITLKRI